MGCEAVSLGEKFPRQRIPQQSMNGPTKFVKVATNRLRIFRLSVFCLKNIKNYSLARRGCGRETAGRTQADGVRE